MGDRPGRGRREFLRGSLGLIGLGLLTGCSLPPAPWRTPAETPRIGVIIGASAADGAPLAEALRDGLLEHGYVEGRTIAVEWRFLDADAGRAPGAVDELLRARVALIVTGNTATIVAAKRATATIPIVMAGGNTDPVGTGLVASLARPGGNVTGLSWSVPTLLPKRLELLKELAPGADRAGALWDAAIGPPVRVRAQALEATGPQLGMQGRSYFVEYPEELAGVFEAMRRDGAEVVHVGESAMTAAHAGRIAELALRHRLPAMYGTPEFVRAGGLMALGVYQPDLYRRAAAYVDKILEGADPAELPIEQPTKFDFVINLKTAEALGLTIPEPVLLQATETIQ